MRLPDKVYDILKTIQRWIPLFVTLYVNLAPVWNLPIPDKISKTWAEIATVLAGILELSTVAYRKDVLARDVSVPKDDEVSE